MYSHDHIVSFFKFFLLAFSCGYFSIGIASEEDGRMSRPSHFILTDVEDVAGVSGYTGRLHRINIGTYDYSDNWQEQPPVISGKAFAGIQLIEWSEYFDKPCQMKVRPWPLNTDMVSGYLDPRRPSVKSFFICSKTGTGDTRTVAVDGYVRAISVCTTKKQDSSKNRLKGIRIWGASLSHQAPFVRDLPGLPAEGKHRNCKGNWDPMVSCPSGYIASGIRIYTNYADKFIRGLGLKCRKVELSRSPFKQ